jgi:hypothetical protein
MANVLTTNPIRIDSVMATSYKAAVALSLGTLFTLIVHQVRWLNPITGGAGGTGDEVLIIDPQSGQELLRLHAVTAGAEVVADWSAQPRLWRDFQVVQLGSGRVDIFTK